MKHSARKEIKILLKKRPQFHVVQGQTATQNYAIADEVLLWISKNLDPADNTLETGCGYSTIVFALLSNRHTVISPFRQEHELIKKWCEDHEIPTGNVEFIVSISEDVIHSLVPPGARPDLGMALIDGRHAFPAPFIDWYYSADRIKKGGYLIVDDTHLITGKILRDFLAAEKERWKLVTDIGKTVIFQRLTATSVARGIPLIKQPYVNEPYLKWQQSQGNY